MLMTDPNELSSTLRSIKPSHVAVAYLGSTWHEHLTDLDALEEIVVSPTIGSYPWALSDLMDKADEHNFKVLFSENLHAKLFIGKSACMIGSPNLSNNGFGGGLDEAAAFLEGAQNVQNAVRIFEGLKSGAVEDCELQREIIEQLKEKWLRARRHNTLPKESGDRPEMSLTEWSQCQCGERVILTWYYPTGDLVLNTEGIKAEIPEYTKGNPNDHFIDYLDFAADDDIRIGDWLLCWAATDKGQARRNKAYPLVWMHVNKVIPNGSGDPEHEYSLLAVTLKDSIQDGVTPPFAIDQVIERLVPDLLDSGKYEGLKLTDDHIWRVKDAERENLRFLDDLQKAYRKATAE